MKDKEIQNLIAKEEKRQREMIRLIASENYASRDVQNALATVLGNKYSEGYPGKRYYPGNEFIDEIELLAQKRAKKLFRLGKDWEVNVIPYSGTPANLAIYLALAGPHGKIVGMSLDSGGHLSHGHPVTTSGKFFNFLNYGVDERGFLDYDELEEIARSFRPKLIVSGASAYPRKIDYKRIKQIANSVGALHMTDIAHIAGLIAGGALPTPFPYCDVVMTTTHKSLRGPRGAMIFARREHMPAINKAVFPGLQGGPHDNQTAAIAVALEEALSANFKAYAQQIIINASVLARELSARAFNLSSGGTDNHLMLIDLREKNISGKDAEELLYAAGIVVNRNAIPHDPTKPMNPSGIRLGTPAVTTRGMKEKEMRQIAKWISEVLHKERTPEEVKKETLGLTKTFPVP